MISGMKGMIQYSKEIKLMDVQICNEQGKTHKEVMQELGLPRKECLSNEYVAVEEKAKQD